jgi:prevent-host-death family protein
MKKVTVRSIRSNFSEILSRVQYGGEKIAIERNGKIAAVLAPVSFVKKDEARQEIEGRETK